MTNNDFSRKSRSSRDPLYKIPNRGKICGVCAGIAEYFGFETWVVRVIAVSLLIFVNGGMVIAYFVACWLMDTKPGSEKNKTAKNYTNQYHNAAQEEKTNSYYRPNVQEVWRKGSLPEQTMERIKDKFDAIETRLRGLETFVTSDKFSLHRAFKDIQD